MSNVGTIMKALGRNDQAYEWWWKALRARPVFWDATVGWFRSVHMVRATHQHLGEPTRVPSFHSSSGSKW